MGYLKKRSTLPANRRVDLNTEIRQGSNERYEKEIEVATLDTLYVDENLDARVKVVLAGDAVGETSAFVKKVVGLTRIVNFSCTNGSVGATVDGIGIQSGASVALGKSVIFTITPEEGYEYTGTNPETVVVSEDITKAYECTPPWTGLKFTSSGATEIAMVQMGSWAGSWPIEYSLDNGSTWSELILEVTVPLSDGASVCFRGQKDSTAQSGSNYRKFVITGTGTVAASGDVTSLLNGTGGVTDLTPYGTATLDGLFRGCSLLTSAPSLPSTTLTTSCYSNLFNGCSGLLVAPALPASTLATSCYANMFSGCTSLTESPTLPALQVNEGDYAEMFSGCSSLNTITVLATSVEEYGTEGWVEGVYPEGDFYGKFSVYWGTGVDGIPEGWTEHLD